MNNNNINKLKYEMKSTTYDVVRCNASRKPTIDVWDVTFTGNEFQSIDTLLPK